MASDRDPRMDSGFGIRIRHMFAYKKGDAATASNMEELPEKMYGADAKEIDMFGMLEDVWGGIDSKEQDRAQTVAEEIISGEVPHVKEHIDPQTIDYDAVRVFSVEQRTMMWHYLRRNVITSTEISKLMAADKPTRGTAHVTVVKASDDGILIPAPPKKRRQTKKNTKNRTQVEDEILASKLRAVDINPPNEYCQWGIDHEDVARKEFMQWTHMQVHTNIGFAIRGIEGCSPDGIIVDEFGSESVLEIKCPFYRLPNEPRFEHIQQVKHQLKVLDLSKGILYYWRPNGAKVFNIHRDKVFDERSSLRALDMFLLLNTARKELAIDHVGSFVNGSNVTQTVEPDIRPHSNDLPSSEIRCEVYH